MIYIVLNNDFHLNIFERNILSHIKNKFIKIIIPYNIVSSGTSGEGTEVVVDTPFRERRHFWNPFLFNEAKKEIEKIQFIEDDLLILFTEYDPLNQYCAFKAKSNGSTVVLIEKGIATYYSNVSSERTKLTILELSAFFTCGELLAPFLKFNKLGRHVCQMEINM